MDKCVFCGQETVGANGVCSYCGTVNSVENQGKNVPNQGKNAPKERKNPYSYRAQYDPQKLREQMNHQPYEPANSQLYGRQENNQNAMNVENNQSNTINMSKSTDAKSMLPGLFLRKIIPIVLFIMNPMLGMVYFAVFRILTAASPELAEKLGVGNLSGVKSTTSNFISVIVIIIIIAVVGIVSFAMVALQ